MIPKLRLSPPAGLARPLVCGPGSPMEGIQRLAERVARTRSTALLTGETGTGKEVLARLIHVRSDRAGRAFVPVNCGAIPESLVESELFGNLKGAFTGAFTARKGRVAYAEGGTLFLDEIGELPLAIQVKLLRLLQEHTYEPVGSAETVFADFRLVAATHRDLAAEVEAGRFRADLYYRLMVCPIDVPALRDRPTDIPVLFNHFWAERGETRPIESVVYAALGRHPWPGNIRELENLVERVSVCADSPRIGLEDLPAAYQEGSSASAREESIDLRRLPVPTLVRPMPLDDEGPGGALACADHAPTPPAITTEALSRVVPTSPPALGEAPSRGLLSLRNIDVSCPLDLSGMLRTLEDAYIDAALARFSGSRKAAAELLGLQRTTLVEKLRRRERLPLLTPSASGSRQVGAGQLIVALSGPTGGVSG